LEERGGAGTAKGEEEGRDGAKKVVRRFQIADYQIQDSRLKEGI
jgi:hypothetical protein